MNVRAGRSTTATEQSYCLTFAELLPDAVTWLAVHVAIAEIPNLSVFIHCCLHDYPTENLTELN